MDASSPPAVLIIGVGNPFRRDDAAGLEALKLLKDLKPAAALVEHSGEGAALMESWKGADAVILIDAARSGAPPGTIHRLDPIRQPLPTGMFQDSTHAFSIPQAIELGRALNQLPRRIVVYGIEGRDFSAGTEISPEVRAALPDVAAQIFGEVASLVSGAR